MSHKPSSKGDESEHHHGPDLPRRLLSLLLVCCYKEAHLLSSHHGLDPVSTNPPCLSPSASSSASSRHNLSEPAHHKSPLHQPSAPAFHLPFSPCSASMSLTRSVLAPSRRTSLSVTSRTRKLTLSFDRITRKAVFYVEDSFCIFDHNTQRHTVATLRHSRPASR